MLKVQAVSVPLKISDRFTMDIAFDDRSWWERHAPFWAGGKVDPRGCKSFLVTGASNG